jgi:tetratricopeptide (TPR) repeat protein
MRARRSPSAHSGQPAQPAQPARRPAAPWLAPALAVLSLLAGAGAPRPARADSLERVDSTVEEGVTFLAVAWDAIEYRVKSGKRRASGDEVRSIVRESTSLQAARSLLGTGNYRGAVAELEGVAAAAKVEGWEKAEAAYLLGEALRRLGDLPKAADAYQKYLDAHRDGKDWWVPEATNRLGEIALERGQWGTAGTHYKALEKLGAKWEWHARLGEGISILRGRGKAGTQDARKLLLGVARGAKDPVLKERAQVERIRAILIAEQYDQVVKELEEDFFGATSGVPAYGEARAWATLLMARALAGLGKGPEGKASLEKAEMWFLQVDALYREEPRVYAEACDGLAEVYSKLGKAERAAAWKKRKPAAALPAADTPPVPPPAPAAPGAAAPAPAPAPAAPGAKAG